MTNNNNNNNNNNIIEEDQANQEQDYQEYQDENGNVKYRTPKIKLSKEEEQKYLAELEAAEQSDETDDDEEEKEIIRPAPAAAPISMIAPTVAVPSVVPAANSSLSLSASWTDAERRLVQAVLKKREQDREQSKSKGTSTAIKRKRARKGHRSDGIPPLNLISIKKKGQLSGPSWMF